MTAVFHWSPCHMQVRNSSPSPWFQVSAHRTPPAGGASGTVHLHPSPPSSLFYMSLRRRMWLAIVSILASLLCVSLLLHVLWACGGSAAAHFPERRDYSYVPLNDIKGDGSHVREDSGEGGLDESDSQDEIWAPSHSGRS